MDFKSLTYVLALAEHGTIVKAAKAVFISQPSYSKFLQALDEEIGIPLFERIGNRYQLTYAGRQYVETARKILDLRDQLDK